MINKKQNRIRPGLVFEKSITRDWGIIYAELWHKVFTEQFEKVTGWEYSEVVFEGQDNTISINRAPSEHITGMRAHIMNQLDNDPDWIHKHAQKVREQYKQVISWGEKVQEKDFSEYGDTELAQIAKDFMKYNIELGPRFIMMLWFPIQMENHELASKYKSAVTDAIKARHDIEKIGPFVDEFGRKLGKEVAKRAYLPMNLSKYISINEVLNYLEKEENVDMNVLQKRAKYFIVTNKGILYEDINEYFRQYKCTLKYEEIKEVNEVRGNAAYLGIVKGRVSVIKNRIMFDKFKEGEILVTSMTTPDFLPIMKMAAAFITDEGGITCHASIVAREMKRPCIIGTKTATQVLHDGDLVEVDADNGVVRILEKA
ncbi:hypothetical protein GOV14_05500 [Candidatus Pacearchaeota archaeon]|nr:hypothetical protein [Candidatus Pacearchaeota archaeon]